MVRDRSWVEWVLVRGHRLAITAIALGVAWVTTVLLIEFNVVEVGPASSMPTLLSGVIAGQLTLITVTLSINQLILSRMFASPPEIEKRYEGTVDFRRRVADVLDEPVAPIEPALFLDSIARVLRTRSRALADDADAVESARREAIVDCAASIREFAVSIEELLGDDSREILSAVSLLSHEANTRNTVAVERLQADGDLPASLSRHADDLSTLLEAVSEARQHFKTLLIQRQLSRLSRYIVYIGVPSILLAVLVLLAYTSNARLRVSEPFIRPIAAFGVAVLMAPATLLGAYVLRFAVIVERTVSTGPFLPPE